MNALHFGHLNIHMFPIQIANVANFKIFAAQGQTETYVMAAMMDDPTKPLLLMTHFFSKYSNDTHYYMDNNMKYESHAIHSVRFQFFRNRLYSNSALGRIQNCLLRSLLTFLIIYVEHFETRTPFNILK